MAEMAIQGPNSSSETVLKALRVLTHADQPLGITDFHRLLDEPTSSIHRALATLEEGGYAQRYEGTAKFVPGPMCFHLVRAMVNRFPIRMAAQPALRQLVAITESSATLNVRLGWFSLRIAYAEGRVDFFQGRRVGECRLLHEDVAPLAMLSRLSDEAIADYRSFVARRLPHLAKTALSPALDRQVAAARNQDFVAKADAEKTGRSWVGFGLVCPAGEPFAAIGVNLPNDELNHTASSTLFGRLHEVIDDLRRTALADSELCRSPFSHLPAEDIMPPLPHHGTLGETLRLDD